MCRPAQIGYWVRISIVHTLRLTLCVCPESLCCQNIYISACSKLFFLKFQKKIWKNCIIWNKKNKRLINNRHWVPFPFPQCFVKRCSSVQCGPFRRLFLWAEVQFFDLDKFLIIWYCKNNLLCCRKLKKLKAHPCGPTSDFWSMNLHSILKTWKK